jgi:hypothetical protein
MIQPLLFEQIFKIYINFLTFHTFNLISYQFNNIKNTQIIIRDLLHF